ncbi:MAG TPA: hypothetical protein VF732_08125, partial [Nitrospira sp.]
LQERADDRVIVVREEQYAHTSLACRRLRARHEWAYRRATNKGDELTPSHSTNLMDLSVGYHTYRILRRNVCKQLRVPVGTRISPRHRVTGGGRPPPVPTERGERIYRTTLFGS